ncbi:MAG: hypothetical protein D6824_01800 [Planctomycetota bacterium]|nr:MAG: hypothetical protein D6824_01800 [Planctomycetota bacterium]
MLPDGDDEAEAALQRSSPAAAATIPGLEQQRRLSSCVGDAAVVCVELPLPLRPRCRGMK